MTLHTQHRATLTRLTQRTQRRLSVSGGALTAMAMSLPQSKRILPHSLTHRQKGS